MKKNLPEADFRFDGLIRLQSEAVKWELIKTSIRLKVYDSLQKPKTAEKIASELSLHRENTEYMLKALVAIGMLELHDGCYINSDFSEKFFVSGSEQDIGRSILYIEAWNKERVFCQRFE